jgi:phosphoribosylformimino-5-aminoimidazole carboxamide ribotide isomerase
MILYPAIDLICGAVVRLHKGDFAQLTQYGTDPLAVAKTYADAGATWLHLVDLDGAKNPQNRQIDLIANIISSTGLLVQTGGGIRSADDVAALLDAGAARVVIGSLAVRDPDVVKQLMQMHGPEKICLAADVILQNDSFYIAVSGWQEASDLSLFDFLNMFAPAGLTHVLCTDIDRDGTLRGFNRALYTSVKQEFSYLQLQASGGASRLEDLKHLDADGVIIGKALYEGRFSVAEALEATAC